MSACDPRADTGRDATLPLRFGLDPAFYPEGDEQRGDHVLYAGRLEPREGRLRAAGGGRALRAEPWPLWLMGAGSAAKAVAARIRRLGLAGRVAHPSRTSATARRSPPPTAAPAASSCRAS